MPCRLRSLPRLAHGLTRVGALNAKTHRAHPGAAAGVDVLDILDCGISKQATGLMGEHRLEVLVLEERGRIRRGRLSAGGGDGEAEDATLVLVEGGARHH